TNNFNEMRVERDEGDVERCRKFGRFDSERDVGEPLGSPDTADLKARTTRRGRRRAGGNEAQPTSRRQRGAVRHEALRRRPAAEGARGETPAAPPAVAQYRRATGPARFPSASTEPDCRARRPGRAPSAAGLRRDPSPVARAPPRQPAAIL